MDLFTNEVILGIVEWWAGFIAAIGVIAAALWRVWLKIFKPLIKKTQDRLDDINDLLVNVQRINKDMTVFTDMMEHLSARQWSSLDTIRTAIVETDENGLLIRANRAYLRLVDRQIFDVTGNGWAIVIHPDDREAVVNEWKHAVTEQRGFEAGFRVLRPNGSTIKVFSVASAMRKADGTLIGWISRIEEADAPGTQPAS